MTKYLDYQKKSESGGYKRKKKVLRNYKYGFSQPAGKIMDEEGPSSSSSSSLSSLGYKGPILKIICISYSILHPFRKLGTP